MPSPYENLTKFDERIKKLITNSSHPTVLGFLPISDEECEEICNALRSVASQREDSKKSDLLYSRPAATLFAMAHSISDNDNGQQHWKAINRKLNLNTGNKWNQLCERALNKVKTSTSSDKLIVERLGHFVPFLNFQTGIKRCWLETLKRALNDLNKAETPPPEPDNPKSIRDYTKKLAEACYGQQLLQDALKSPVGNLIVESICRFDRGEENAFPSHLRKAFAETRENRRNIAIRTPYLQYQHSETVLVLPRVKPPRATNDTLWELGDGRKLRANFSQKPIPCQDLAQDKQKVKLINLAGEGLTTQRTFSINPHPTKTIPYHIYRASDGREIPSQCPYKLEVPPGEYHFRIHQSLCAGEDAEYFQDGTNDTKHTGSDPIELTADQLPLIFKDDDKKYQITCKREATLNLNEEIMEKCSIPTSCDLPLFYGSLPLEIKCPTDIPNPPFSLWTQSSGTKHYDAHTSLHESFQELLIGLSEGIHLVKFKLFSDSGQTRQFYFWKGLKGHNEDGLLLDKLPLKHRLKGFSLLNKGTLPYDRNWHEPQRIIILPDGTELFLPSSGFQALLLDPENDEEPPIEKGSEIPVEQNDHRRIKFTSAKQSRWEIYDTTGTICTLTPRRHTRTLLLANLLHREGSNGELKYKDGSGKEHLLARLLRPFTVESPETKEKGKWNFSLRKTNITALGFKITGNEEIFSIARNVANHPVFQGIDLTCKSDPLKKQLFGDDSLYVKIHANYDKFPSGSNVLEILAKDAEGQWQPINCTEEDHSRSMLALPFWGNPPINQQDRHEKAISHLRILRETDFPASTDPLSDFFFKKSLPDIFRNTLSNHSDGWWQASANELTHAARNKSKPFHTFFLFATFPQLLTTFPSQSKANPISLESASLSIATLSHQTEPSGKFTLGLRSRELEAGTLCNFLVSLSEERKKSVDFEVTPLPGTEILSAHHFHLAMTRLERRSEQHRQRAESEGRQQARALQAFERIYPAVKIRPQARADLQKTLEKAKLQAFDQIHGKFWFAPTEDEFSKHISTILFHLAFYSRLRAHNKIRQEDFWNRYNQITEGTNEHFADWLSFAPELFAFYIALFDLTLSRPS